MQVALVFALNIICIPLDAYFIKLIKIRLKANPCFVYEINMCVVYYLEGKKVEMYEGKNEVLKTTGTSRNY